MKAQVCLLLVASLGLQFGCTSSTESIMPVNLRTEYAVNPIGISTNHPRFTWEYAGKSESFRPETYEIRIGTDSASLQPYTENTKLSSYTRYYWNVAVKDKRGAQTQTSEIAVFETGKIENEEGWIAKWITDNHDKEFEPAPMFRKMFSLGKSIEKARLFIASAGYHEAMINGKRVGKNYLDPGYTHFDKRILYVEHDVSDLLRQGENVIGVVLGNGWYNNQSKAVWNFETARWRNRPSFMAELRVTYEDGTTDIIPTDDSWITNTGAYTYNNLYSGDMYDARLEKTGWNSDIQFDDSGWTSVKLMDAPAPLLSFQQTPPIQITAEYAPSAMKKFNDKLYVYTFPVNMAGFCRLKVSGQKGTEVSLRYGELLTDDGRLNQGNISVYYHPEKPYEHFQTDVYILKGDGEEVFVPSFTYHGFQFVEVESSQPIELTEESLTALSVHTNVESTGTFTCSLPMFNNLWEATMRTYCANLHSIPTDCPQREKNGWTADAHVAMDLALLGFDGILFYEKWLDDYIDNQREAGDISGIIPSSGWGYGEWPGPVWDAALFIIPNALYDYYGDKSSIEKMYPTMERYLSYLKTKEKDGGYLTFGLGDWVYWKSTTNNEYTSTAYYYWDNLLMSRFAELLGKDSTPYKEKAEELKGLINKKFFDAEKGIYAEGTQSALAVALYLGLVPAEKEQLVADNLRKVVADNDHFLDFGLLGSKTVLRMLTKYGYVEDAMKMATKTELPSWGYWIEKKKSTTLPETWKLSETNADASLNHVFLGDIVAWMMNQITGINYDTANPGFSNVLITPHFVKDLEWAKGEYRSVKGKIVSEWRRTEDGIVLTVTIPTGCSAEIHTGKKIKKIGSGTHTFNYKEE